jgi:hypothetical protein
MTDLHRCSLRFARTSKDHTYPIAVERHRATGYGSGWFAVVLVLFFVGIAISWVTR